jgi:hypothetical protein
VSTLAVPAEALGGRAFGRLPKFDPTLGQTVVEPTGQGSGYWVGAPSVYYDSDERLFYLYHRVREPRPVRGKECHIAASSDGLHFDTIWTATQEQIGTSSMERSCLTRSEDGLWRLYLSYVHPGDSRWRIDLVEADRVEALDVTQRRAVLTADDTASEGVKDPWVATVGPLHYMLASFATKPESVPAAQRGRLHSTGDVYNTGVSKSSTGLAISEDGLTWHWQGEVFAPSADGWDCWASRLGCLVYVPPVWVGFYDGAAGVAENYEERCGMAVTTDLRHFYRASLSGPAITSPHGSGCVRYVDGVHARGGYWFYYEYTRPDGSHELRLSRVSG